jgi:adenosine kinase
MNEDGVLGHAQALVITRGEEGCSLYETNAGGGHAFSRSDVTAIAPHRIVDPTGVGDAFRGGFMKGMAAAVPFKICAQLGTVAATYALEHLGGQSHAYTMKEFSERYGQHFGPLAF